MTTRLYIVKNAVRDILRSPGRTIIICLIVVVISAASCIALSIQQSAQTARANASAALRIRGRIRADRQYVMEALQAAAPEEGGEEASGETEETSMQETLKAISGLSLEELQTYAAADAVQRLYYYATLSLSGDNGLTPLNQDDHADIENAISDAIPTGADRQQGPGRRGPGGGPGGMNIKDIMASINFGGDFLLYGYSSDEAMEEFQDGTSYITAGSMFPQGTAEPVCIINEDLATYNGLGVGSQISLSNPAAKGERYALTVVGVFKNTADTSNSVSQAADDPANHILTSYAVVQDIVERSKAWRDPASVESLRTLEDGSTAEQLLTDDGTLVIRGAAAEADSGEGNEHALSENVSGTYLFATIEDFDAFEAQARELGLSENYTVTSSDVAGYEASLVPLDNLSAYANTFLYIVLGVGAVILIGVNVFNIRERKYEIGALTAMGMRKGRVARQFMLELTIVTFLGIVIGSGIGAVASTPVTNTLLASQIAYEESNSEKLNANFGREVAEQGVKPHGGDVSGEVQYVSSVTFSFDYDILYKMILIGAALALVSSAAAIGFVLRYNPLEILAERD